MKKNERELVMTFLSFIGWWGVCVAVLLCYCCVARAHRVASSLLDLPLPMQHYQNHPLSLINALAGLGKINGDVAGLGHVLAVAHLLMEGVVRVPELSGRTRRQKMGRHVILTIANTDEGGR